MSEISLSSCTTNVPELAASLEVVATAGSKDLKQTKDTGKQKRLSCYRGNYCTEKERKKERKKENYISFRSRTSL